MKVYCPYCRKDVEYKIEKRDIKEFKGVKINTFENVGICIECNNDLYINLLERENNERIYNVYKEKSNIITGKDIIDFRNKYNISQRELTSILGFGKMTINRYERGDIPTKSQSDYLKLLIENEDKFIEKVKDAYSKELITKKTYLKVVNDIVKNDDFELKMQDIFRRYIKESLNRKPDIYNGYKVFDLEKLENIISYIASKVKNLTVTSINKYLWYIDMYSFKQRTVSITGLTYQNQKFGPTILDQKYNEITVLNDKYKREDIEIDNGTMTKIVSNKNYDLSEIENDEKEIIDFVIKLLKNKKVTEISEMSHNEIAWKKTKRLERISYEYAMDLKV